ncbi:AAA family ATPase [Candidatus Saganbacteria bacterium]|nr:AAA family ATPase [Candidatus Saganbacteria bacterium]
MTSEGKRVYIAATRQNDGKTIVSLGLFAALKKRLGKIGYIKPVGQHYLVVDGKKIDKDAVLIDQVYNPAGNLPDMSPIAVPHGFTEHYIQHGKKDVLSQRIQRAFKNIQKVNDFVLIEGTGHAGVGAVFDMSNSDVASLLHSKVILVSIGGVGKPIDEIMLNKAMFDQKGVEVLGVIINKVHEKKIKKISRLVRAGLARKKIELFGVIPYRETLSSPTIQQLLEDLDGKLLGGAGGLQNNIHRMIIGAMPPHEALGYFGRGTLLITPGSREDLVLAAMSGSLGGQAAAYGVSGIILTGKITPHRHVLQLISDFDLPIIQVKADTFSVASYIHDLIVKIRPSDRSKICATEELVENHVNIDRILEKLG